MSDDVEIPYEVLNELNGSLKRIVVEFENASDRSNSLEAAIGSPHGRGELRSAADRFEAAWNNKRDTLKESVQSIQEHVEAVGQAWKDWDAEASASLSVDEGESSNLSKGN